MLDALIMDAATAQAYRDATAGRNHQLNPRPIDAGSYAGQYFLPARLLTHWRFATVDWTGGIVVPNFDVAAAWPETVAEG